MYNPAQGNNENIEHEIVGYWVGEGNVFPLFNILSPTSPTPRASQESSLEEELGHQICDFG